MNELIIVGPVDPDALKIDTPWILECPSCGQQREVCYARMRQVVNGENSFCKFCTLTIRNKANSHFIEDIPNQLVVIEQFVETDRRATCCLVECPICGKRRIAQRANIVNQERTVCADCSAIRSSWTLIENTPDWLIILDQQPGDKHHLVKCPDCGKEWEQGRDSIHAGSSSRCDYCRRPRGAEHDRWKGGKRHRYGDDWPEIRQDIWARDEYRCQFPDCDYDNQDGCLHTHHIIPWGDGGTNEFANLITLCPSHHTWCERHLDDSIPLLDEILAHKHRY